MRIQDCWFLFCLLFSSSCVFSTMSSSGHRKLLKKHNLRNTKCAEQIKPVLRLISKRKAPVPPEQEFGVPLHRYFQGSIQVDQWSSTKKGCKECFLLLALNTSVLIMGYQVRMERWPPGHHPRVKQFAKKDTSRSKVASPSRNLHVIFIGDFLWAKRRVT